MTLLEKIALEELAMKVQRDMYPRGQITWVNSTESTRNMMRHKAFDLLKEGFYRNAS